ncbi:XdhC family protein [Cytobacillus dafuensis]|uniref:XdhC family protein n=1 Tax=Cytobacillus dafuensis TaxID=1742359 RepID=UPI000AFBF238|nr:XdhC family protein [Cytobacillus dafuensis]
MIKQSLFNKITQSLEKREEIILITFTEHSEQSLIGEKALVWPNGDFYTEAPLSPTIQSKIFQSCERLITRKRSGTFSFQWNETNIECFAEYFPVPLHLIVAGAGHVCEPVAHVGKMLGFFVTVIDDRPDYANRDRFPDVDEVICESYMQYFKDLNLSDQTYVLLLTRGHKYDVLSLQELLKREEKAAYIGMIGSRRRISGVFEELKKDFPMESFDHLYTPVGLDIGAETPSEIAVSIMAEILKIKNQKSGQSLSTRIRDFAKMGFHEGATT